MCPIIVCAGYYFNVKFGNIAFSVDGNWRFKVIISNGGAVFSAVLRVLSAADVGAVLYNL